MQLHNTLHIAVTDVLEAMRYHHFFDGNAGVDPDKSAEACNGE